MIESAKQTEVYLAVYRSDGKVDRGQRVHPPQSREEYEALGSPVVAAVYDAYAVGVGDDYWAIYTANREERPVMIPNSRDISDHDLFEQLARDVEEHLGRTGLTVLVS